MGFENWRAGLRGKVARRKKFEGDDDGGNEVDEGSEDPHQRAGKNLIGERGDGKDRRGLQVRGVEDAVAENQEGAKRGSGKHAEEKIEGNRPAVPACFRRERLEHGPPEEDGGGEKTEVFDVVPEIRAEGEIEGGRNVPGEEGDGGENPADEGMGEKFSDALDECVAEKRAERGTHEGLRQSVEQRKRGSAEKDEGRNHEHEENVLDHVNGEGGFVESRERRADGEPEKEHAGEESEKATCVEKRGRRAMQSRASRGDKSGQ